MPSIISLIARHDGDSHSLTPITPDLLSEMDMSNMDHSSHTTTTTTTLAGNHMMNMAFHTSITDNLFSEAWAPKTTGQYAGACIFLIVFAIIHRALSAYKSIQDAKWHKQEKARVVVVAGGSSGRSSSENDPKTAGAVSDAQSVKSDKKEEENPWTAPWRFSVEVPRAALSTLVSGVGYLLMLAIMTFNVGYFMSIIAGIFVGELAFGRIHKHGAH